MTTTVMRMGRRGDFGKLVGEGIRYTGMWERGEGGGVVVFFGCFAWVFGGCK